MGLTKPMFNQATGLRSYYKTPWKPIYALIFLYEKAASKATSAEPPPRWAIGTGQLSCLQFRSGPIARRGGGGIIPFSSASTTLNLLCLTGHSRYITK